MVDLTKVRYAVLVAVIGLAVAMWPGLTDFVSSVIQWASVIVGALWGLLRIASEFVMVDDPEIQYLNRGVEDDGGFWGKLKRAL